MYLWRLSPAMTATTAGVAAVLVLVAGTYGSFTRRTQRVSLSKWSSQKA